MTMERTAAKIGRSMKKRAITSPDSRPPDPFWAATLVKGGEVSRRLGPGFAGRDAGPIAALRPGERVGPAAWRTNPGGPSGTPRPGARGPGGRGRPAGPWAPPPRPRAGPGPGGGQPPWAPAAPRPGPTGRGPAT